MWGSVKCRSILAILALLTPTLLFQNCSYSGFQSHSNDAPSLHGGTGADGKLYVSYDRECAPGSIEPSASVLFSKNTGRPVILRENCQDLSSPRPILPTDVSFGNADNTVFALQGKIFDYKPASGAQRVTLELCQSATTTPAVKSEVWQVAGNSSNWFGRVEIADGTTTGILNMLPPVGSDYRSVSGQPNQFSLTLASNGGASLSYTLGAAPAVNVNTVNCLSQESPTFPDDGSTTAPPGLAPRPNLLLGYSTRASWKVAGVDYAGSLTSLNACDAG